MQLNKNGITTFEFDLGKGWKLTQKVDDKGIETFNFTNNLGASIVLNDESVKKLRKIIDPNQS